MAGKLIYLKSNKTLDSIPKTEQISNSSSKDKAHSAVSILLICVRLIFSASASSI